VLTLLHASELLFAAQTNPEYLLDTGVTVSAVGGLVLVHHGRRYLRIATHCLVRHRRLAIGLSVAGIALVYKVPLPGLEDAQSGGRTLLDGFVLGWQVWSAHHGASHVAGGARSPVERVFVGNGLTLLLGIAWLWLAAHASPDIADPRHDLEIVPAFGLLAFGLPLYLASLAQRLAHRQAPASSG
jgi:hypothetical protein